MDKLEIFIIHFGAPAFDAMRLRCIERIKSLAHCFGHSLNVCSDQPEICGVRTTISLADLENDIATDAYALHCWESAKATKAPRVWQSDSLGKPFNVIAMSDVARMWLAGKYDNFFYCDTDVYMETLQVPLTENKPYFARMNADNVDLDIIYTNGRRDWFKRWKTFEMRKEACNYGGGIFWQLLNRTKTLKRDPNTKAIISGWSAAKDIGIIDHVYFTHKDNNFS